MAAANTVTVANAAQLQQALASAHAGETILLASGDYGSVTISNLHISGGSVTLASANGAAPASLSGLHIKQSSGLAISGIELDASGSSAAYANTIANSQNITLTGLNVHGNISTGGLQIANSASVVVSNSNFHTLADGISESNNSNISILNNHFSYIEGDGVDNADVTSISIDNNTFTNAYGGSVTSHPDAIQFWTTGTTHASSNIDISGNTISLGSGAQTQGIFLTDQVGNLPYENVNISGNTISGESWNGITVDHAQSVNVSNNTVLGTADLGLKVGASTSFGVSTSSEIMLENTTGGSLTANNSSGYVLSGNSQVSSNANAINGALHPAVEFSSATATLTNLQSELILTGGAAVSGTAGAANQTIIANSGGDRLYDNKAGSDTLIGGAGNDVLIARNPNDILTGAGGSNTFQVMNTTGNVTVTDFALNGSHDNVNISSLLAAGHTPTLTSEGNNTVISFSGETATITLLGVHADQLVASSTGYHL